MKKAPLTLIVILILAFSCGKKSAETNQADSDTANVVSESSKSTTKKDILTENISLDSAATLISNFLNERSFLQGVAQSKAIGGTFFANQFDFNTSPNNNEGALMWFCYNANDSSLPGLFLSTQKVSSIYPFPTFPIPNSPLIIPKPKNVFTYNLNDGIDPASVIKYLKKSLKVKDPVNNASPLERTKAIGLIDEFSQWKNQYPAPYGGSFSDLAFSFFKNEPITSTGALYPYGLTAFLNQKKGGIKPVYVRYYFGYEPEEINGKLHNKIRIILIAADIDGGNFVEPSSIIIQKSVPPF